MIHRLNDRFTRSPGTLIEDFLGAAALIVTLYVGLHLPTLF